MIEYILLFIFFILFIPILHIKIKYPFWSNQPIFHTYDYLRFWTRRPYIIQTGFPSKNKYLSNKIVSMNFLDIDDNQLENIVRFIQEHYVDSDKVLTMISSKDIQTELSGNKHPSYLSFYTEKQINYDSKSSQIVENNTLVGCITSRAIKIYMNTPEKFQETVYYWDYICTHRNFQDKYLGRNLIQTHERYQRLNNLGISASLFKFESTLCPGVVPLINYTVHTYPIVQIIRPPMSKFSIERIKHDKVNHLYDYLYNITHNTAYNPFEICIFPDTISLDHLIQNDRLIVYGLFQKSKMQALYFFKDPKLCYDNDEGRNVIECVSSISLNDISEPTINSLYFGGFLHALYDIQLTYNNKFKLITFFEMANNENIIERWKWKYNPLSINQSAFYLYNAILPRMPFDQKNALIIL